jgi:amphi-Trp domain-containing protein
MSEVEGVEVTNGESKGKFKHDSTLRRDEAVAYFQAIVSGLKQGTIHFKQGDKELTVHPAPHLEVSVRASKKGKYQSVSFEIGWRPDHETELEITS